MKTESLSSDSMHICGCYLGPCLPGHGAGGVSKAPLEEWFHGWGDEVLADSAAAACGHHQRPSRVLPQELLLYMYGIMDIKYIPYLPVFAF